MTVLRNAGVTHTLKLICTNAMANFLLPTLESYKVVSLLYHFHRDVARAQARDAHAAIADIYFTKLTPAVKSVQLNLGDLSHLCGNKVSCRIICDN